MSNAFVNSLSLRQHLQTNAFVFNCAPGLAVNAVVRISAAGTVAEANSSNPATMPAIGMVVAKPTTTTAIVIQKGRIGGFGGLSPGDPVYVSQTVSGGIQNTPGPSPQQIGVVTTTTEILLDLGFGATGGGGGTSTTGPTLSRIPLTSSVSGIGQPSEGLVGSDIITLDHPHLSTTGQKFEWIIPDDYAGGSLDIVAIYGMSTAVAGPNNVVRLRTKISIAHVISGAVDEASYPNTDSNLTTPAVAVGSLGAIVEGTAATIAAGMVSPGDSLEVTILRLGADAADKHTGLWQVVTYAVRYTTTVQTRAFFQKGEIFSDTSLPPPAEGVLGTDIDVLDFPSGLDTEQKVSFLVPDSWDQISDAQLRLDYAIGANVTGTVRVETAGEMANVGTGAIDTLAVVDFDIVYSSPAVLNAPQRSVVVRSLPAASLTPGNHITFRIRRVTSVGGNLVGTFRLINATLTLGQAPNGTVTQALIEEKYLTAVVFGNLSGPGVSADVTYPNFAGDFERLVAIVSTVASGRIDGAFEGRFGLTQTKVDRVRLFIKGAGATPQYRLKVYADGSGAVPVYDSGVQVAPGAMTEVTVSGAGFSAQPTGAGRFFVVVESYVNNGDTVFYSYPQAKQE